MRRAVELHATRHTEALPFVEVVDDGGILKIDRGPEFIECCSLRARDLVVQVWRARLGRHERDAPVRQLILPLIGEALLPRSVWIRWIGNGMAARTCVRKAVVVAIFAQRPDQSSAGAASQLGNWSMALRWKAVAMAEAARDFRRLTVYGLLSMLRAALAANRKKHAGDTARGGANVLNQDELGQAASFEKH